MRALDIYAGSDGDATKRFYAALEARGAIGTVAVNLFRAQKSSARAKVYRGGVYGGGSFRRMAYDRKAWALENLTQILVRHASELGIRFGWRHYPELEHAAWVLYVDLPQGQVSFHSVARMKGPDYPYQWDGQRQSPARIVQFCDAVLAMQVQEQGCLWQ